MTPLDGKTMRCLADIAARIADGLNNMIEIQMGGYPSHWSEADKREMAERHLFARQQGEG